MIELPADFRDLLVELHDAGVDFVVIGGREQDLADIANLNRQAAAAES